MKKLSRHLLVALLAALLSLFVINVQTEVFRQREIRDAAEQMQVVAPETFPTERQRTDGEIILTMLFSAAIAAGGSILYDLKTKKEDSHS